MNGWSLSTLLAGLHADIQKRLEIVRETIAHPGSKGDSSEQVWLELLQTYLPKRYQAEKAHVVDSNGSFSQQIDVLVFDRQYTPFIFNYQGAKVVPAEGVYAAFEAKQTINASLVQYAQDKIASVRGLHRTSLPIPYAGGTYPPKSPPHILGGILTFDSDWSPPIGEAIDSALKKNIVDGLLDVGCIAAHGNFVFSHKNATYEYVRGGRPATAFLLKLIALLQFAGTVPMIDVDAYASWLSKTS